MPAEQILSAGAGVTAMGPASPISTSTISPTQVSPTGGEGDEDERESVGLSANGEKKKKKKKKSGKAKGSTGDASAGVSADMGMDAGTGTTTGVGGVVVATKQKTKKKNGLNAVAHRNGMNGGGAVALPPPPPPPPAINFAQQNHNVLQIARNKHWKYISSYHGPWLQLPLELLQSLLLLNMDPSTSANDFELTTAPPYASASSYTSRANANTNARAISASPSSREFGLGRGLSFERLRDMNAPSLGYNNRASNGRYHSKENGYGSTLGVGDGPPPSSNSSTITTTSHSSASTALTMTSTSTIGTPNTPTAVDLPPGRAAPPPIDPGVFTSVVAIRRLVDESADLAVRASSGLSAAALGALQSGSSSGGGGGRWGSIPNPLGGYGGGFGAHGGTGDLYGGGSGAGGGRNVPMSATRVHRLRAMAVQRLADAYRADEVAASVMVMQRGTVFDDLAERVLKVDPKNVDARYVQFFHEKIPSRQLAESTTTTALDQLIDENPHHLYLYRTRGIVHGFREEYVLAIRDYTFIVKDSRAQRRAREAHMSASHPKREGAHTKGKRKKKVNGQAPPNGTSATASGHDETSQNSSGRLMLHPSVLPNAPDPVEMQALFYRGSAYLAQAYAHIESTICALEDVPRISSNEFGEIELAHIAGKYGGIEVGNPLGPLGGTKGRKCEAYRAALAEARGREQVETMLKRAKRDHERFLAHFDSLNAVGGEGIGDEDEKSVLEKMESSYLLIETLRPSARQHEPPPSASASMDYSYGSTAPAKEVYSDVPLPFTTYHPLMLESYFSVLNCLLLLGDFEGLVSTFERTARIVAGLEGYPVFLPPRSMAQAEFVEVLERLANGWKLGRMENALILAGKANRPQISAREKEKSRAIGSVEVAFSDLSFENKLRPPPPPPSSRPRSSMNMNGSSSSSHAGRSSSFSHASTSASASGSGSGSGSGSITPLTEVVEDDEGTRTPNPDSEPSADRRSALEHLRYLLTPIHTRLDTSKVKSPLSDPPASYDHTSAGARKDSKSAGGGRAALNLVLHGARVEVILAWVAAVHLPELEGPSGEL